MIRRRHPAPVEPELALRLDDPLVRGALLEPWREERAAGRKPLEVWRRILGNEPARHRWTRSRGKGGFVRVGRAEALDLLAAAIAHEMDSNGGAALAGMAPSPLTEPLLYTAGRRLVALLGGLGIEQLEPGLRLAREVGTSAAEGLEKAASIVVLGPAPLQLPRGAAALARARLAGARVHYLSPLFDALAPLSDEWVSVAPGGSEAFWDAVAHVVLAESQARGPESVLAARLARQTDAACLVRLEPFEDGWRPGRRLDADAPGGGAAPLSLLGRGGEPRTLLVSDGNGGFLRRAVPSVAARLEDGEVPVATVYDLLFAFRGVGRGLAGDWPSGYEDCRHPATPAWQAERTGIDPSKVIELAREWLRSSEASGGRLVLCASAEAAPASTFRAALEALLLAGASFGSGGGLRLLDEQPPPGLEALASASDWLEAARTMDRASWEATLAQGAIGGARVALRWGWARVAGSRELLQRHLLGTSDLGLPPEAREVPRGALDLFAALTDRLDCDAALADLVLPVGSEPGPTGAWETARQLAAMVDSLLGGAPRAAERFARCGPSHSGAGAPLGTAAEVAGLLAGAPGREAPKPRLHFDLARRVAQPAPVAIGEGVLVRLIERYASTNRVAAALPALGRGCRIVWIEPSVALELGIADGDWVELSNEWGALCASAATSPGVPAGSCVVDTLADLPLDLPRSPALDGRRSGTAANLRGPGPDPGPGGEPVWATVRRLDEVRF